MFENAKSFYKKQAKWVPLAFFLIGFLFDAFMLRRIDDLFAIVQQGVYLLVAGTLIRFDFLEHFGKFSAGTGFWSRVWKYREAVIHFMLGTLMNAYTIFYFKSASVMTSFVYVGVLVVILTVTEFKKFGGAQTIVHTALWTLCLISYSLYLVPILMGFIGRIPFLISILSSAVISAIVYLRLRKAMGEQVSVATKRVLVPFVGVHLLFVALYLLEVIPPVPLSVSFIGIYHGVKKEEDKYLLTYTDPSWKFWRRDDQPFVARANDKIYCFARIFSPARFRDQLRVRWLYRNANAGPWHGSDAIALPITGGREEGFRGYTVKTNYTPGDWRCQIETSDNREIGRVTFRVEKDDSTEERSEKVEVQ